MDEEREFNISSEDYAILLERAETMLETKVERYFDVYEYTEILDSYIEQAKLHKAYSLLCIAQKQHPNNTELEYRKARIYVERNDADAAIEISKKLLKIESTNPDLYSLLGVAYAIKNEFALAEKSFDKALQLADFDAEDILYNSAVTFINHYQFEQAKRFLEQAHVQYPENLLVIYDLAYCYERLRLFAESVAMYKKYINLDPYSEYAWYNMALVYLHQDKLEEAIECFEYAIAINEDFVSAHFTKGNCLMTLEKYIEAIDSYQEIVRIDPDDALVLLSIGDCYEKLQDYEHAQIYYEKVTEMTPEFSEGWFGLALIQFVQGNSMLAKKLFEKSIELDDENDKYWISYGVVLKELDLYEESKKAFEKALSLTKFEPEAWMQYSQLEYDAEHVDRAIALLHEGLEYCEFASLYYTLSAIYANEQNFTEALSYFEKAYTLEPELSTYFFDVCVLPSHTLELFHNLIYKK